MRSRCTATGCNQPSADGLHCTYHAQVYSPLYPYHRIDGDSNNKTGMHGNVIATDRAAWEGRPFSTVERLSNGATRITTRNAHNLAGGQR